MCFGQIRSFFLSKDVYQELLFALGDHHNKPYTHHQIGM